jgi:GH18 family chitinase
LFSKKKCFFWFIGAWDNVTGINAPLYGRSDGKENKNDIEWNVVS